MNRQKLVFLSLAVCCFLYACTRVHIYVFAVEPIDSFDSPRELYMNLREHLVSRGFRIDRESADRVSFQLASNQGAILPTAPSDYLTLAIDEKNRVSVRLERISSGGGISKQQLDQFKEKLTKKVLERTGKHVRVTLISSI